MSRRVFRYWRLSPINVRDAVEPFTVRVDRYGFQRNVCEKRYAVSKKKKTTRRTERNDRSPASCRLVNSFSSSVLSCIVKFSNNKQSNATASFSDGGRTVDMTRTNRARNDRTGRGAKQLNRQRARGRVQRAKMVGIRKFENNNYVLARTNDRAAD